MKAGGIFLISLAITELLCFGNFPSVPFSTSHFILKNRNRADSLS